MLPTLQIYVCNQKSDNKELLKKYITQAAKHNRDTLTGSHPDSGFDVFCPNSTVMCVAENTFCNKIPLGIKCGMVAPGVESTEGVTNFSRNKGYYVYPRSSTGSKTTLRLANSVGIIDSGYRGELMAIFDNIGNEEVKIEPYQRLVQICAGDLGPFLIEITDSLESLGDTTRGSGGFGSTGT